MALNFEIKSIPHSQQRYETVGDYQLVDGKWIITVSDMGNDDYNFLVALHELYELYATQKRGITEESISAYDMEYEKNRTAESLDECGDNKDSPYYREHQEATALERLACTFLDCDWNDYDKAVNDL
jgi:hypothetical protein